MGWLGQKLVWLLRKKNHSDIVLIFFLTETTHFGLCKIKPTSLIHNPSLKLIYEQKVKLPEEN